MSREILNCSLEGSKYTCKYVDDLATKKNMNRSKFIQFLIWDYEKKRRHHIRYTDVAILILLGIMTLCMSMLLMR